MSSPLSQTIRVRFSGGTTRVTIADPQHATVGDVRAAIANLLAIPKLEVVVLSRPNDKASCLPFDSVSLKDVPGMSVNGVMVYLDESKVKAVIPTLVKNKAVDVQGNLVASSKTREQTEFRPGVASLRSQKLHWTLTEMTELDDKFTFRIKGNEPLTCGAADLDLVSAQGFQNSLRQFGFKRPRLAHLFGSLVDRDPGSSSAAAAAEAEAAAAATAKKYGETKRSMRVSDFKKDDDVQPRKNARIEVIYEPAQECHDGIHAVLVSDPRQTRADVLCASLQLEKVGFIVSHPPGRQGYNLSAHEIIVAGLAWLDATNGSRDTPYVIVRVTADEKGVVEMHAFQLTSTCLDMIAEDALLVIPSSPGYAGVRDTFTCIVEAKAADVLDTDLLIRRVPIVSHTGPFSYAFPRFNRDNVVFDKPSDAALRKVLMAASAKSIIKALLDFDLLLFLGEKALDQDTLSQIASELAKCAWEGQQTIPDGYLLLIREVAGVR